MHKNLLSLFCLLLTVWVQAQSTVTISGTVTRISDNSPVADWSVLAVIGDSTDFSFGEDLTDPNGFYTITLNAVPGFDQAFVGTATCSDPGDPFGGWISEIATIVNGAATVNFQICEFPPFPDCWAYFYFEQTDSLTFTFYPFYAGPDSNAVGVSYLWDFGDGTTSTEENPTHTFPANGFYEVTLTVTGSDGCTATITYPVSTDVPPTPDCFAYIVYEQLDSLTYQFQAVTDDPNGGGGAGLSYLWDFGDGNTSTDPTPTHTYADQGAYTVFLTVTNEDSCVAHACDIIFTFDCPVDTFWYGCQAMFGINYFWGDSTGTNTDPLTVQFEDYSFGAVEEWHWDFGDGSTSDQPNPTHTYAQEGVYTVTLAIETVDGCESEISFEIYVGEDCPWDPEFDCQALFLPLPDSIGGNGIQFIDLSVSPSQIQSWSWNFGDGTVSTDQNPFHEYAQPGVYTVSLSISADSCQSTISFEIDTENPWQFANEPAQLGVAANSTKVKEAAYTADLALYPNPVKGDFLATFTLDRAAEINLEIVDLSGRILHRASMSGASGVNALKVDAGSLTPGLYFANLRSASGVESVKFVKE